MNYNYGNTIHMALSIPEEFNKCKIPRFILQPLVENAVLHGVDKATNKVRIEIVLSAGKNILCFTVFSQGTAIAPNQLLSLQHSLISVSPFPEAEPPVSGLRTSLSGFGPFTVKPTASGLKTALTAR